ncbi:MAG TPA: glycosyltransferase [Nitrososphaeraceae archaeon]|nr:glycosyltransferase [Nitrososphaeraceae archaeon]
MVLALKIYLLLFVMDFVLGLYTFFSSFTVLNILVFSYFRYRDPIFELQPVPEEGGGRLVIESSPSFSIVVPVKNEEENIRNCVESCINQTYKNREVIIVNDGSTDDTPKILDSIKRENPYVKNFYILHINKSVGKKRAVEAASQIAKGEIYAFMDSDCDMDLDAVKIAAKIFVNDKNLGALTGHVMVRNASKGNTLEKMQSVYADGACRGIKGAESTFDSVTCCSGALSFYRRECVQDFIHEWAHDKFLGMDFKFCTDRRMTAHVLTAPRRTLEAPLSIVGASGISSRQSTGIMNNEYQGGQPVVYPNGDFHDYPSSSFSSVRSSGGDEDGRTSSDLGYWNVKYSYSIKVHVGVPNTLQSLIKQQVRWKKSFIRSLSTTGGHYWKRPAYIAVIYYIMTVMKFIRPYVVFHAVFMLPFVGELSSTILWLAGILFTSMIYGVDFKIRNPDTRLWLYRPAFTLMTTFVYTWLLPVAMLNIRSKAWR